MSHIIRFILAAICLVGVVHGGMECPLHSDEDVFKLVKKFCPRPDLDSNEEGFCCINHKTNTAYCCDPVEWTLNSAIRYRPFPERSTIGKSKRLCTGHPEIILSVICERDDFMICRLPQHRRFDFPMTRFLQNAPMATN